METSNYVLKYKQGTTFRFGFKIRNKETGSYWDLTGWTATMTIKAYINSTDALKVFTSSDYITLDGSDFSVEVPSSVMALLPIGNLIYDIDLSSPTEDDYTPLNGKFAVSFG